MTQTSFTHSDLETLWVLHGGLQEDADTAAAIAQAESGGCLYAKHGPTDDRPVKICTYTKSTKENSYGLWQINRQAHPQYSAASLYTAAGNAAAAVAIRTARGNFTDWTTFKTGAYKKFLTGTVSVTPQPGPTFTPTDGATTPHMHGGWADLRNSVNKHLPRQLAKSNNATQTAYRALAHRGRKGH